MSRLIFAFAVLCAAAQAGTIFLPGYPDRILVVDEATRRIIDRIPSEIGIPTGVTRSYDRRKIYLTSNDNDGIAVIDIATRKVLQHFVLNSGNRKLRINGVAPDPDDKVLYTVVREVVKQTDRYEVGQPKYAVIDLSQQKIVRTAEIAPEDRDANFSWYGRSPFHVSPDGKYLYQFRDKIVILDTSDFHVVDRIDLAKPDFPDLADVSMGAGLETLDEQGAFISVFNADDPIVHRRQFGFARFDLNSRQFNFTEIGPAPNGMLGVQIAPDRTKGYSVVVNGEQGNRRCEFWAFDIEKNQRTMTAEFPCRPRFSFGISGDGRKLYVYGAGFEIEVWDTATLKLTETINLHNDATMGGMVVVP